MGSSRKDSGKQARFVNGLTLPQLARSTADTKASVVRERAQKKDIDLCYV